MAGKNVSEPSVPLLYARPCVKKERKETGGTESAAPDAEVMGNTRYVYLDENAGKTAAPFHEPDS